MAIIDMPLEELINTSSGPTKEGFDLQKIEYSDKISQVALNGPTVESSKVDVWKIVFKPLTYRDPTEVALGQVDQVQELRDFYQLAQLSKIRWKPFEYTRTAIWEIVPNSLSVKQLDGPYFQGALNIKFLYFE